jgi:hypothetical protein
VVVVNAAELDLTLLADDGDTLELTDGRVLRLRVEADHGPNVNDYDCYGRVEHVRTCGERHERPAGFTGAASKVDVDYPYVTWWQPPTDVHPQSPGYAELRQLVIDLVRYGFKQVGVELIERCDHGHEHVVNAAWLGGVDELYPEIIAELVGEVLP